MPNRFIARAISVCVFAIALAPVTGVAQAFRPAVAGAADNPRASCTQLTSLELPDVRISEAVVVLAATTGAVSAPHCKVSGVIGTEIKFALLLPDTWNQKFMMGGGGGFVGTIDNQAASSVNLGFATVGTDTGHAGNVVDASWALNNLERRVNYGYVAVHRTAEVAKAIVRSYYGADASRSYFSGCSNGGRQGMMEAQRYPDDFDGIVAGAPAMDFTGIAAQFMKDIQTLFPDPKNAATSLVPAETMKLVGSKILDICDAADGVKDGVMDDPRACKVDFNALPITDVQKAALKKVYAPTTNKDGEIFTGQPFGGETEPGGWPMWISGGNPQLAMLKQPSLRFGFGTQFFKYFVFNDPSWEYSRYDLATWKKDTELTASFLNATDPNLDAFKGKGHKLIMSHGWADAGLSPLATIKYYDAVKSRDPNVNDYFRLFLMPGVLHCGGGAGPDSADWTAAIVDWVEKGKAPERIIASKTTNGAVTRTRPLCQYPQRAIYKGSGSTDDEANFVCR
jgi:Tannase and feruloyl esterase